MAAAGASFPLRSADAWKAACSADHIGRAMEQTQTDRESTERGGVMGTGVMQCERERRVRGEREVRDRGTVAGWR